MQQFGDGAAMIGPKHDAGAGGGEQGDLAEREGPRREFFHPVAEKIQDGGVIATGHENGEFIAAQAPEQHALHAAFAG